MTNYQTCPVLRKAERALSKADELERYFRRLGRATRKCNRCDAKSECPFMQQMQRDIDQALILVWKSWDEGAALHA